LPKNERLYCDECTSLTNLPELPKNEYLYCHERLKQA